MDTVIEHLLNNPAEASMVVSVLLLTVRFVLYPFLLWLTAASQTTQAAIQSASDDQKRNDAIVHRSLDIMAQNTTAIRESNSTLNETLGEIKTLLKNQNTELGVIRTTTESHRREFQSVDLNTRLKHIETNLSDIRRGVLYVYRDVKKQQKQSTMKEKETA